MIIGVGGPVRIPEGPWRFIKACVKVLVALTLAVFLVQHFSMGALLVVLVVVALWRRGR